MGVRKNLNSLLAPAINLVTDNENLTLLYLMLKINKWRLTVYIRWNHQLRNQVYNAYDVNSLVREDEKHTETSDTETGIK